MALLPKIQADKDGEPLALVQAVNCTVDCDGGRTALIVNNGAGAPINVTLATVGTDADGNAVASRVIAVAAGTQRIIRLNPDVYGPIASVAYSATTTITHAAVAV